MGWCWSDNPHLEEAWKLERGGGNFQTIVLLQFIQFWKWLAPDFFKEGKDQEEEEGGVAEAAKHLTQKFLKGCASATPSKLSSRP